MSGQEIVKAQDGWLVVDTDGERVGPFVTFKGALAYACMLAGWR
jgi:hypothetical protein